MLLPNKNIDLEFLKVDMRKVLHFVPEETDRICYYILA